MAQIKVKRVKVEDLKAYEQNPRRNSKAVGAVYESIKKFGFRNPIIINPDGVILAGNTRLEALQKAGIDEVDCIELNHLTKEQENAFRIADNRVADFSFWDKDLLEQEMMEIGADDWKLFGFKDKDLEFLKAPDQCTCPRCGKSFIKV